MTYLELQKWRNRIHDLYCEAQRIKQAACDKDQKLREHLQSEWYKASPLSARRNNNDPRVTEER